MRQLSLRQAQACENALKPRCACRCGGAAHGKNRPGAAVGELIDREFFEELPVEDPHHIDSGAQRRQKRNARRRMVRDERKQAKNGQLPLPWQLEEDP